MVQKVHKLKILASSIIRMIIQSAPYIFSQNFYENCGAAPWIIILDTITPPSQLTVLIFLLVFVTFSILRSNGMKPFAVNR